MSTQGKKYIYIMVSSIALLYFIPSRSINSKVDVDLFHEKKPRVVIVFVIDQFAYHYIQKLKSYFRDAFKTFLENGIVYTDAYVPHGMPATSVGHAALSSGTYAKNHGIIGNEWIDDAGSTVKCDQDDRPAAAVFAKTGFYPKGKSPQFLMVDTLSDQFALASTDYEPSYAYSVSLKSRAAILTAGKLGKAFWFDEKEGRFTSSRAYFEALPEWIVTFNERKKDFIFSQQPWQLRYDRKDPAYSMVNPLTYNFVPTTSSLIGKSPVPIKRGTRNLSSDVISSQKQYLAYFTHTPSANQLLLDCAYECLEQHTTDDRVLLWVCISSTDKLGHDFGSNSYEMIDMIYHLDKQLEGFMHRVQKKYGDENVLYALAADHGVIPIIELLQHKDLSLARRMHTNDLTAELNAILLEKYGCDNLVFGFKVPQFFLDMACFKKLHRRRRKSVVATIKEFLYKQPGIKTVWSFDELSVLPCEDRDFSFYFKNQLFRGRSGYITVQTYPYSIDTKWNIGTDHRTPYEYDTHVPLMLYQPHVLEKQKISRRVTTLQLAPTIADICNIQRPSASTVDPLPLCRDHAFHSR